MSSVVSKNYQIGADGTATNNFTIRQPATPDGTVRIANGNTGSTTDLVTLTSAGNLGVGVTPSAWSTSAGRTALQIGGSTASYLVGNNGLLSGSNFYYNNSGSNVYVGSGAATLYQQYNGAHSWFTAPSGTAGNAISFTQAMTLDASGQLGIGATSPGSQLHLAKALSSTQTNAIQIQNTGVFTWGIGIDNAVSNSSLVFQSGGAGGTTRMAIDSSGNLLVGTTNSGYNNRIVVQAASGAAAGRFIVPSTAGADVIYFMNPNGVVGSIVTSGTGTSYNTSSDYRLKENIQPMTGALAKVAALKPVTYKWKADGSEGQGFIAHELQEVVSDCVTGEKDAVETYTDEDGVEQTRPVYQGIDTSFLVATLTAAIQELKAINDAQAQTITALTARVEALENAA